MQELVGWVFKNQSTILFFIGFALLFIYYLLWLYRDWLNRKQPTFMSINFRDGK